MTPTQSDLASIRRRLQDLESEVRSLSHQPSVPAALPVDKMQLADYAKATSRAFTEPDEETEEEDEVQPNLTRGELQELASAIRDYLEWSAPQSHLNETTWQMVNASNRERLERAVSVAERELRRTNNA